MTIDDVKVASIDESIARERFEGEGVIVRKGKKVFQPREGVSKADYKT